MAGGQTIRLQSPISGSTILKAAPGTVTLAGSQMTGQQAVRQVITMQKPGQATSSQPQIVTLVRPNQTGAQVSTQVKI